MSTRQLFRILAVLSLVLGVAREARAQADAGFNPGANGTNGVLAVAIQPDGKVLVGGDFTTLGGGGTGVTARSRIARLNSDGSLDTSFNPGASLVAGGIVYALAVQPDGKILVGGQFTTLGGQPRNNIGRLDAAGNIDGSFDPGANADVRSILVQPDGGMLVSGSFTFAGGQTRNHIAWLEPGGAARSSFNPGANGNIYTMAVQADGQIVVGGNFTALGGGTGTTPRNGIGLLNPNGTVDPTFDPNANFPVFALAIQPDEKILVGGRFSTLGAGAGLTTRNNIARLNASGSIDTAFNPGTNAGGDVYTFGIQADGRILVGGLFSGMGGGTGTSVRSRIARLNADAAGSVDVGFNPGLNGVAPFSVQGIAQQKDGWILVVGKFTAVDNLQIAGPPATRNNIARLTNLLGSESSVVTGSTITWTRGAGAPEVRRVVFEASLNGTSYTPLGEGTRVAGGWQLTGQTLSTSQTIRARGFYGTGLYGGSGSIVESTVFQATTGTMSGTVTEAGTGFPIIVVVKIFNAAGAFQTDTTTDAAGHYTVSGLPAGTYYALTFTFNAAFWLDELYNQLPCVGCTDTATTGTPIVVTAGTTRTNINFTLAPDAGAITGRVTDAATGSGINGLLIRVYNSTGAFQKFGSTSATGDFKVSGLPPGIYYARTVANGSQPYANEAYDNIPCVSCNITASTPIFVFGNTITGGVTFALTPTGSVTGTVTETGTGAPLPSVLVQLFTAANVFQASAFTDASGNYTIGGLQSGTYYASTFVINTAFHHDQLFDHLPCKGCSANSPTGTAIVVTAGATHSGVNFALAPGAGAISGVVTDEVTGLGLGSIEVDIFTAAGAFQKFATTDASGAWFVGGLAPGSYVAATAVSATQNYVDEAYDSTLCLPCLPSMGTLIAVAAGVTRGGVNFALAPGGSLSGTVTDAATHAPVGSVGVVIYTSTGLVVTNRITDAAGAFSVGGLAPGSYFVRTRPTATYAAQVYSDLTYLNEAPTTGTPVVVTTGGTQAGVDFALLPGGSISGTVTDAATGAGLIARVLVYTPEGRVAGDATTGAGGAYTVTGLPAGTYYASTGLVTTNYVDMLYDNQTCLGCAAVSNIPMPYVSLLCASCAQPVTTGTPIAVSVGATRTGVDFPLTAGGGGITGSVVDAATGRGVPFVEVSFYKAAGIVVKSVTTGNGGTYSIGGLTPGIYYARTIVSAAAAHYSDAAYGNVPCAPCDVTATTAIPVAAHTVTPGIDFSLGSGGSIAGVVTDAGTSAGISGATVRLYSATGSLVKSTTSGSTGSFEFDGMPAGTYYALVVSAPEHLDQLFSSLSCASCDPTAGTPILVNNGETHEGVIFALGRLPSVTTLAADTGETGAILHGSVTPNGTSTVALFDYGPTTSYGSQVAVSIAPGAGFAPVPVSAPINGLVCETEYHFRAVAMSAGGQAAGSDIAFTTATCSPFVVELTANVTFPVLSNTPVTWTATVPHGGKPPFTYLFAVNVVGDPSFTVFLDYGPSNTFVWTPTVGGTYEVNVRARNAGSTDRNGSNVPPLSVVVVDPPPPTVALTSNVSFPIDPGTAVTWTAAAANGTSPYSYRFEVFNVGTGAVLTQGYRAADTLAWTPAIGGSYRISVWARSAGSATDDAHSVQNVVVTTPPPVRVTSLTPDVTFPVAPGAAVTWTADATGGYPPYSYRFSVRVTGGDWVVARVYDPSNTFIWTPVADGSYEVMVSVRNAGSSADADDTSLPVAAVVTTPAVPLPAVTSFTANVSFPVLTGTPVTWTAAATGGVAPYSYRFLVNQNNAGFVEVQAYSASNTLLWTPAVKGDYQVQVYVRNAGSATLFDVSALASAAVNSPFPQITLSSNVAFPVTRNTPVTWTATVVADGLPPFTYAFTVATGPEFSACCGAPAQAYGPSSTFVWTPTVAGTYYVYALVRNAGIPGIHSDGITIPPATAVVVDLTPTVTLTSDVASPVDPGTPITWTAQAAGGFAPYKYRFTVNDGAGGQDYSASNTFVWTPPNGGAFNVTVSVRNDGSAADRDAFRTSEPFVVNSPPPPPTPLTVTLHAPDGGEKLFADVATVIRWSGTSATSFDVALSRNGGAFVPIAGCTNLPATASGCVWTPAMAQATSRAFVRVTAHGAAGALASDTSNASFRIVRASPAIRVTAPNTAVTWTAGVVASITWTHNLDEDARIRVELSRNGGGSWETLAASLLNTGATSGALAWTVTGPTTTNARIRVSWPDAPVSDVSDSAFSIVAPAITLSAPNTAVNWRVGTSHNIAFMHNLGIGQRINIAVSRDGGASWGAEGSVITTAAKSGSLAWVVDGPLTTAARVRVAWAQDAAVQDQSDVNFAVISPITVTAPNSAVVWGAGSTRTITWNHVLGSGQRFDIEFSPDGGSTWTFLAFDIPAASATTGTYTDRMPVTTTTRAVIRVSPAGSPLPGDTSGVFTIAVPSLKINTPNTNIIWRIGSTHTISWSHNLGAGESVRIEIIRDGGGLEVLADAVPNTANVNGSFSWVTTGPAKTARIRISWTFNGLVQDFSDVTFRIQR